MSSQSQQEENNDEGSNNAEEVDASPDTMPQNEVADEEVVAETDESTYVHVPTDENVDEHDTETEPLPTDESTSKPQSDDAEKDDKINS